MTAATLALLVSGVCSTFQPEPAKAPPKEAVVVRVRALDSGQAGKEFHELVQKAKEEKAPALVLIVEADLPWRSDVVRDALADTKEAPVAVAIGPSAPGAGVSWGAAALGLAARHLGTPDGTLAVRVETDAEARGLVAGKVDWPGVEADLRDLLAPHTARRGWVTEGPEVLVFPREGWWSVLASRGGPRRVVHGERPSVGEGERVQEVCKAGTGSDPAPFTLDTRWVDTGTGERVVSAGKWQDLCRVIKVKAPARAGETTTSSVAEVREGVVKALEQVRGFREQVEQGLVEAEKKGTPPQQAARAGMRERSRIRGAETALKAVEALLDRFPEVLRTVPPGSTTVNAKPGTNPAKWRTLVQGHRDALAKLEARAAALEEKGK